VGDVLASLDFEVSHKVCLLPRSFICCQAPFIRNGFRSFSTPFAVFGLFSRKWPASLQASVVDFSQDSASDSLDFGFGLSVFGQMANLGGVAEVPIN